MRIMLLGAPGVGKGSQAVLLAKILSIPHISTGDIFRFHTSKKTELGKQVSYFIEKGTLVPDDLTMQIVIERLKQEDCSNGFILDGFPRTIQQAVLFDDALNELNIKIDIIINIVLNDDSIKKRLTGRLMCPKCTAVYHIEEKVPKYEGLCDNCYTKLIRREDDREEIIIKRLQLYHNHIEPILDYYKNKVEVKVVKSKKLISETTKDMLYALGLPVAMVKPDLFKKDLNNEEMLGHIKNQNESSHFIQV